MNTSFSLQQLGWQAFFQQQLTLTELDSTHVGRIVAHHRNGYTLQQQHAQHHLPISRSLPPMTVGDWLLVDQNCRFQRLLERKSLLSRKAAGTNTEVQLIAANIDVMFIVCSLNQDFNLNRIERYLSIAHEAQVEPVVVLSKQDLAGDWEDKQQQVQALDPFLAVYSVNTQETASVQPLLHWCQCGSSVSFLGSSGVGKSTLVNTLLGREAQATQAIRADDDKGRHTTTSRALYTMQNGALLLDTPGMRELQLMQCDEGLLKTFADIEMLESQCRFSDCQHQQEPGCAVQAAMSSGRLDPRRLNNFLALRKEQARNNASLHEKRAKDKALSKKYRSILNESVTQKRGY